MKTKICSTCKKELPLDFFYANKTKKDGTQTSCKECKKKYNQKHYVDNQKRYISNAKKRKPALALLIRSYKLGKSCSRCLEDDIDCLQFHHLDPSVKEMNVSQTANSGWSITRIEKEIAKCILLCANCHIKEHVRLKSLIELG